MLKRGGDGWLRQQTSYVLVLAELVLFGNDTTRLKVFKFKGQ